jgi:hypothetical protein
MSYNIYAKQGIEPRTTDHETVMLPLHYFADRGLEN